VTVLHCSVNVGRVHHSGNEQFLISFIQCVCVCVCIYIYIYASLLWVACYMLHSVQIQGDQRKSDGFQKKKYSVDFQLEMDLFLQN